MGQPLTRLQQDAPSRWKEYYRHATESAGAETFPSALTELVVIYLACSPAASGNRWKNVISPFEELRLARFLQRLHVISSIRTSSPRKDIGDRPGCENAKSRVGGGPEEIPSTRIPSLYFWIPGDKTSFTLSTHSFFCPLLYVRVFVCVTLCAN